MVKLFKLPNVIIGAFSVFALTVLFSYALGYEQPRISLVNALQKAKSAFVARIIKVHEIKRYDGYVEAEAQAELVKCFFGLRCPRSSLKIIYRSQSYRESEIPVEFKVSEEYLFVLQKQIYDTQTVDFDSSPQGGLDNAFMLEINTAETGYAGSPYLTTTEKIGLKSVYGFTEDLTKDDIVKLTNNQPKNR